MHSTGKLWYNLLTKILKEAGWKKSQVNACVMHKIVQGRVCIIMIYIDDLLVVATKQETECLKGLLKTKFDDITVNEGREVSFLGMQITFDEEKTIIDMPFFVNSLLNGKEVKTIRSPGTKNTFIVDKSSPLLVEQKRQEFCSLVAKFLYLAKQARPNILTVTSFFMHPYASSN
jgi:hypothetical protein